MRNVLTTCLLATALAVPAAAQKQTCAVSNYGKGCGPVLTGKVTPQGNTNKVAITVSKAKPGSTVILMVGGVKADLGLNPFFGGPKGCHLLVVPIFFQQHMIGADGTYKSERSIGAFIGTAHVQFAQHVVRKSGSSHFLTTNGVTLTCK